MENDNLLKVESSTVQFKTQGNDFKVKSMYGPSKFRIVHTGLTKDGKRPTVGRKLKQNLTIKRYRPDLVGITLMKKQVKHDF